MDVLTWSKPLTVLNIDGILSDLSVFLKRESIFLFLDEGERRRRRRCYVSIENVIISMLVRVYCISHVCFPHLPYSFIIYLTQCECKGSPFDGS